MVKQLVDHGASPERVGYGARTLESIAKRRGDAEPLAFLESRAGWAKQRPVRPNPKAIAKGACRAVERPTETRSGMRLQ